MSEAFSNNFHASAESASEMLLTGGPRLKLLETEVEPITEEPAPATERIASVRSLLPRLEKIAEETEDSYDASRDETTILYPDLEFSFNEKWVLRSGVVAPTLDSRTRAVLAAAKASSQSSPETREIEWPDLSTLQKNASIAQKYSQATVSIIPKHKARRADIIAMTNVVSQLENKLARQNHPAYQAMRSLTETYPDDLPEGILRDIKTRFYSGLAPEEIKSLFDRAVKAEKQKVFEARDSN
jgi:hypothetical protein